MSLAEFDMRQLLEAGVHFGHQTHRWNPKMAPYIYGARNNVHIVDLTQTVPLLARALHFLRETAASGGRVLFVGTKRQASGHISSAAKRCGQYYVNHRWLGGMLTNWQTISKSIKVLKDLDEQLASEDSGFTKKERLQLMRQREKFERALGGIREMGGLPDVVVVIDTNREDIAVKEAATLKIPVVAVLDTNCNPDGIAFPIPGNDDATRAIALYCDLFSAAVLEGIQDEISKPKGGKGDKEPKAEKETKGEKEPKGEDKGKKEAKAPAKKEEAGKKAPETKAEAKKEPEKKAEKKTPAKKAEEKPADKKPEEEKKPAAKETAPKKAASKKAEPKKATVKKAPAKKAPAKKAPAKKAAAKKPAAKKAPGKKPAAKKK